MSVESNFQQQSETVSPGKVARRNDGSLISGTKAQEVWAAIEALVARGQRVNQRNIRTEMGGGSNSTINPVLREYRAGLGEQPEDKELPIPGRLTSEISLVARQLWNVALGEAHQQYAADRAELNERTQEMQESEIMYEAEIQIVQTQLDGMQQQLDLLERDRVALETLVNTQTQEIAALQTDLRDGAAKYSEVAQLASKAQQDLQFSTEKVGELSTRLSEQIMKSEALLADNSALKVDLADALTLKDELQRDMATIKTAMTEQSEQLAAATNGLSVVQQELAATKEQLAQETQQHLDVKGALDASTARTGELEATVEALRSALSRCNTDNTTLKEKHNEGLAIIEQLKEQLKEARNELSTLRQDNREYRAENKSLRATVSEWLADRESNRGDAKPADETQPE